MGILKKLTEEYFGDTIREEDLIDIHDLNVEIVSFTDNNGKNHKRGYKPEDRDTLKELLERMIEVRGDEGNFNDIDTSDITSMVSLFQFNETFNGNITGWSVSKVIDMSGMFYCAKSFNQDISKWEFPNLINMSCMFYDASSFNQPIGNWEFPNVENMNSMFYNATSFNQDLSKWDLKGKEKDNIFYGCPIKKEYKPKM